MEVLNQKDLKAYFDFSYITEQSDFLNANIDIETEQVAWKLQTLELSNLSETNQKLFLELRQLVDEVKDPNEKIRLLNLIEKEMLNP